MTVSPRRRGPWQWSRTATGAPSAVPRTPARLAGWVVREAVLALAGEGGTGLAARTARDRRHREKSSSPWLGARGDAGGARLLRQHGRHPRASGGSGGDGRREPQVCPSNRLVTEPSLNTSLIARPSSGAIESTVSLSNRFSCGTGSVLVMMISLI